MLCRVSNLPLGLSILCSSTIRRDYHGQSKWQADSVFEDPFWVGVFEHVEDGKLSVAKVILAQNQRVMKFKSLFKSIIAVCNLVQLWQLL